MKPRTALILDVICWTGATLALWFYNYPTIAALVGATGFVYLRNAFARYQQIRAAEAAWDEFLAGLNGDVQIRAIEIDVNDEDELEMLLQRFRRDPQGFLRDLEEMEKKEEDK